MCNCMPDYAHYGAYALTQRTPILRRARLEHILVLENTAATLAPVNELSNLKIHYYGNIRQRNPGRFLR